MYLFLETDAFQNQFADSAGKVTRSGRAPRGREKSEVRRPHRGIQVKEDTYSVISVRKANGEAIPLSSSSAIHDEEHALVDGFSDFILQSVQDTRTEKQQIIETFGEPFVYFYGQRPRVMTFSGLLVNTEDFNWRQQFWTNYELYLRGTRLVQSNARCYLSWDNMVVEGYPLEATAQDISDTPYSIPFQMSMLVTNQTFIGDITTRFPGYGSVPSDALETANKELADRRKTFVSTTQEVRNLQLDAQFKGGGVLASIRSGIRSANNLITRAGNIIAAGSAVYGGRNVRLPIGIAGFLENIGPATVGAGTITQESGFNSLFDAQTNNLQGVTGSVQLRVPEAAKFAPAWTSKTGRILRGFINENYDEYPHRKQPEYLGDLLPLKNGLEVIERKAARRVKMEEFQAKLIMHNEIAEAGSALGDIADAVSFARSNFGTLMSAAAFVKDPKGVAVGVLGGQTAINAQISTLAGGPLLGLASPFIGSQALNDFNAATEIDLGLETGPKEGREFGSGMDPAAYGGGGSGAAPLYEDVYANQNYSPLTSADPSTSSALTEAYGDDDSAPDGSDINPDSFSKVFGASASQPIQGSAIDRAQLLNSAQSNQNAVHSEGAQGIRSSESDEAPIDPII